MATYLVIFILGIVAARWLLGPLAALVRGAVFVASVAVAWRVATLIEPRITAINWRGFWRGNARACRRRRGMVLSARLARAGRGD